jgi:hypothetical protein
MQTEAQTFPIGSIQHYPSNSGTLVVIPVEKDAWIPRIYEEEYDVWLEYKLWRKELDWQPARKKDLNPTKRVKIGEVFDGKYSVIGKWGEAVEEVRPKGTVAGKKAVKEQYEEFLKEKGYTTCFLIQLK